jgi:hypothetical protein
MDGTFEAASEWADHTSHQRRGRGLWRRHKFLISISSAVATATVTSLLSVVLVSQPQVSASAAQEFFENYYRQVTQADLRKALYNEVLTPAFRESPGADWLDYNSWWKLWAQVDVKKVESDPGNLLEFNVWLKYYPVSGQPVSEEDSFSLVCSTFWAALEARIPALGCPANHLQLQSQLFARETA